MAKVWAFLSFMLAVGAAVLALAFLTRTFVPVGWRGLFSFGAA